MVEYEARGITVRDVAPDQFIEAYAAHLKNSDKFELPKWCDVVKTGRAKELARKLKRLQAEASGEAGPEERAAAEAAWTQQQAELTERGERWARMPAVLDELKAKAKAAGLWNLFLPNSEHFKHSHGLSNLDYAPLAEIMGHCFFASEVFNCSAPDTGNMELLAKFYSIVL